MFMHNINEKNIVDKNIRRMWKDADLHQLSTNIMAIHSSQFCLPYSNLSSFTADIMYKYIVANNHLMDSLCTGSENSFPYTLLTNLG